MGPRNEHGFHCGPCLAVFFRRWLLPFPFALAPTPCLGHQLIKQLTQLVGAWHGITNAIEQGEFVRFFTRRFVHRSCFRRIVRTLVYCHVPPFFGRIHCAESSLAIWRTTCHFRAGLAWWNAACSPSARSEFLPRSVTRDAGVGATPVDHASPETSNQLRRNRHTIDMDFLRQLSWDALESATERKQAVLTQLLAQGSEHVR